MSHALVLATSAVKIAAAKFVFYILMFDLIQRFVLINLIKKLVLYIVLRSDVIKKDSTLNSGISTF